MPVEALNKVAGSKPVEVLESAGLTVVASGKAMAGGAATVPVAGTQIPELAVVGTASGLAVVGGYNLLRHGNDIIQDN